MATGEDKVIKGNMLARNGQIDVLFDTANSSFTGTTEVQNVETIYLLRTKKITAMTKSMVMKKRRMMMNM